jgi:hypothetical protein
LKLQDQKYLVSKGRSASFNFTYKAYFSLIRVLQFNFFSAGVKYGTKKVSTYHFDLSHPGDFQEQKAFAAAAFGKGEEEILKDIPRTDTKIKYFEKFWKFGSLWTFGARSRGTFMISKLPDGQMKRTFNYVSTLKKETKITENQETHKFIARLEFKDDQFKEVVSEKMALEYEVIDDETSFKEMNKRVKKINDLLGLKNFLQYTPKFHGFKNLGSTYINLRLDVKERGVDCLLRKMHCVAKGPKAYRVDRKLKKVRKIKDPIKQVSRLASWLRNSLAKTEKMERVAHFLGSDKFRSELWIEGEVLNRDRYIHRKTESLGF